MIVTCWLRTETTGRAVLVLVAMTVLSGCHSSKTTSVDLDPAAIDLVDFPRVSGQTRELLALAREGRAIDRKISDFPKFAAAATRDPKFGGERLSAYSVELPQRTETVLPMDGSEGVPCWPVLVVIADRTNHTIKRVIVTLQCL